METKNWTPTMPTKDRLRYLCHRAAKNCLTDEELSEILGYVVLNPELLLVIEIERQFLRILRE